MSPYRSRRSVASCFRLVALGVVGFPVGAQAQDSSTVQGVVVEVGGATSIANASVVLEGHGASLTSDEGTFRFEAVVNGEYVLSVDAFGYSAATVALLVSGDTTVTVALEVAPLVLDSLVAELTAIEVDGRVQGVAGVRVPGADVLTSQGHETVTNPRGRFEIEPWEGVPLRLGVRAFGYLPLDTLITPAEDDSYVLELAPDPIVDRMIHSQVTLLENRAGGRIATLMRPMNRDLLARWTGATVLEVLQAEYPRLRRRVRCVVVDEEVLAGMTIRTVLGTTFVDEVERMEFLFSGAMLRVYTRDFIRRMVAGSVDLVRPFYSDIARPPICV